MTITSVANGLGGTDYFIFPAGIGSENGAILETLPKQSVATLSVGQTIAPSVRDIAGDTVGIWTTAPGSTGTAATVKTAAGSGTTTVSAKRQQFLSAPCTTSLPNLNNQSQGAVKSFTADTNLITVAKPSAENWFAGSRVYMYLVSGVATYTNDLLTARAASVSSHFGNIGVKSGVGTTSGYVVIPQFAAYSLFGDVVISSKSIKQIAVTVFGGTPVIDGNIFISPDRTLVSQSLSATTPKKLGTVIGQDLTTTPTTYFYALTDCSSAIGQPYDRLSQSFGSAQDSIVRLAANELMNIILYRIYDGTPTGTDRVYAPNIFPPWIHKGGMVPDMAYDPILPAPMDALRIIWSMRSGSLSMTPFLVRRTTTTAPVTGMLATGRLKTAFESIDDPIANLTSNARSVSFAHGQRYDFGSGKPLSSSSNLDTVAMRAGSIGTSLIIVPVLANVSINIKWGQFQPETGVFVVLPGFPAQAMTPTFALPSTAWSCTLAAPWPTYTDPDSIAQFCPMISVDGGAYVRATSTQWTPVGTGLSGLPIYPFDILRASTQSDSGGAWVGHRGWRWDALPMPAITWGAPPAVALNNATGVLTISGFTTFNYSITAGKGVLSNSSGSSTLAAMNLLMYRLDWLDLPDDMQPLDRGVSVYLNSAGLTAPVTISNIYKPVTGTTRLRVFVYISYNNNVVPHPYALPGVSTGVAPDVHEYVVDVTV